MGPIDGTKEQSRFQSNILLCRAESLIQFTFLCFFEPLLLNIAQGYLKTKSMAKPHESAWKSTQGSELSPKCRLLGMVLPCKPCQLATCAAPGDYTSTGTHRPTRICKSTGVSHLQEPTDSRGAQPTVQQTWGWALHTEQSLMSPDHLRLKKGQVKSGSPATEQRYHFYFH